MAAHDANVRSIATWRGAATIESVVIDANGPLLTRDARATFVYDRDRAAKRWSYTYTDAKDRRDGVLVRNVELMKRDADMQRMITREACYRYAPGEQDAAGGEWRHTLVILPPERAEVNGLSDDFDPMWYLTVRGTPVAEELGSYLMGQDSPSVRATVTRTGNRIAVERLGSDEQVWCFEYDLSQGGNLRHYAYKGRTVSHDTTWTYENVAGTWLPKTFTYLNTNNTEPSKGTVTWKRQVVFGDMALNQSLGANEFTLKALGVALGASVTDRRLGLQYRYDGALPTGERLEQMLRNPAAARAASEAQRALGAPGAVGGAGFSPAQQPAPPMPQRPPAPVAEKMPPVVGWWLVVVSAIVVAAVVVAAVLIAAKKAGEKASDA